MVVTKLDVSIAEAATPAEVDRIVDASIANSAAKLGVGTLDVVCLHNWASHGPGLHGGAAWSRLKYHLERGTVRRIGTSTYHPEEVLQAIADPDCSHVQLPFNLVDHRWRESGVPAALAARPEVTVHGRSCFLQGILAADNSECWPAKFGRELADRYLATIDWLVKACGRKNKADLCLAYSLAQPWITHPLLGVETAEQLAELIELAGRPTLTPSEIALVERTIPRAPDDLVNPGKWVDNPSFAGSFGQGLGN